MWRDYGKVIDLKRGNLAGTDVAALEAAGGVIEGVSGLDQGQRTLTGAGSAARTTAACCARSSARAHG